MIMNKQLILICITIFINNTQSLLSSYSNLASYITPTMQQKIDRLTPEHQTKLFIEMDEQSKRLHQYAEENGGPKWNISTLAYVLCGPCIVMGMNHDKQEHKRIQCKFEKGLVRTHIDRHTQEQAKEQIAKQVVEQLIEQVEYIAAYECARLHKATLISWDQETMQRANEKNPHIPHAQVILYGIAAVPE